MRKIYYVPKGQDINEYSDIWKNHTSEVHNSVSDNIKEYIKDEDVAQWVLIPEFQYTEVPEMISDQDYFQYYFYDDFAFYEEDPQYKMEVYKLNLDVKDFTPLLEETHNMQWEKVLCKFYTEHIVLPVGWYELKFVKEGEVIDSTKVTVYEKHDDISDVISKTGQ